MTVIGDRRGPVLTTKGAAEYCGLKPQTMRDLLHKGAGPKRFKQGRLNVFYPEDLDQWLASRVTDPDEQQEESPR